MAKIGILKQIMIEKGYIPEEIDFILENLSPGWSNFDQTIEEIEKQLYTSFGIWRGLGSAIASHLEFEKQENYL